MNEDVAEAVAHTAVGADSAHQQTAKRQEQLSRIALLVAPGQGPTVFIDVGQGNLASQRAGADPFEEPQEVLSRRTSLLVYGQ